MIHWPVTKRFWINVPEYPWSPSHGRGVRTAINDYPPWWIDEVGPWWAI